MAQVNTQIPDSLHFALQSFLLDCEARSLRPASIQWYQDYTMLFLRWTYEIHNTTYIEQITPTVLRDYLISLKARNVKATTINTIFRALRGFFNFLERDEIISKAPTGKIRLPKVDHVHKEPLSPAEVKRILEAAVSLRDKALVLMLLDTGARISEILALNIGDIDIATGRVQLQRTKNRHSRAVYIGSQTRKTLLKLWKTGFNADMPLFMDMRRPIRLQRNGANQLLNRIGKRAKVQPCNPHRFRRTFAITFLRNGGDIFTLQRLLGHQSLEMVKEYLDGLNDDDTAKAHSQAGVVDVLLR